ncbi:MAG: polysaccharide deacetylase family protein, partial [Azonexus sp.]|nr:polysaccharide deacetylase family protein [Azonexus sp.]
MKPTVAPCNALTIDVEDYFQVSAFAPHIPRSDWAIRECRVERNVDCILAMLDKHDTKGTFFTLGWLAERYPQVVRRIVDNGHELASHGYGHERASDQTPESFFADINLRIPTNLDSDSEPNWTRIPEQTGQSERSDAGFSVFTLLMSWGSSFCR